MARRTGDSWDTMPSRHTPLNWWEQATKDIEDPASLTGRVVAKAVGVPPEERYAQAGGQFRSEVNVTKRRLRRGIARRLRGA